MKKRLGEILDRYLKEKDLGTRGASTGRGSKTHGTIWNVVKGKTKDITLSTFVAVAEVMRMKPHELMEIIESPDVGSVIFNADFNASDFLELFDDYKELSPEQKRDADVLINAIKLDIKRRREISGRDMDTKASQRGPQRAASYTTKFSIEKDDLIRIPMIGPANQNETPNREKTPNKEKKAK